MEPKGKSVARAVVIPDADQTPEQLVGLAPGVAAESQVARRLAENGFRVVVPTLISRSCEFSGNPQLRMTNQPHREWIHRQAYELGRHVIGFEVQKVQSAVDWLIKTGGKDAKIGVAGYGEGGLIAFYAAAVDTRIDACLVSGYFGPREQLWQEPIYRNVWCLLKEFGDAEIASLIAPKKRFVVDYCDCPKVDGPPAVPRGRAGGAALGALTTPPDTVVVEELCRADRFLQLDRNSPLSRDRFHPSISFGTSRVAPCSELAVCQFALKLLNRPFDAPSPVSFLTNVLPHDARTGFDARARQRRQVEELTNYLQRLQRYSDRTRDEFFLNKVYGSGPVVGKPVERAAAEFVEGVKKYRELFWKEAIGELNDPLAPPSPKTRKVYDEPKWTGYEVVLDVFRSPQDSDAALHAWGILCLPKDIKPGQRRPVVVCQHGLEGVPGDVIRKDRRGASCTTRPSPPSWQIADS